LNEIVDLFIGDRVLFIVRRGIPNDIDFYRQHYCWQSRGNTL